MFDASQTSSAQAAVDRMKQPLEEESQVQRGVAWLQCESLRGGVRSSLWGDSSRQICRRRGFGPSGGAVTRRDAESAR